MSKTFIEILKSEDIAKFNPYHDRLGRFTFADGFMNSNYAGDKDKQAVTFSADPNKKVGRMAIEREGQGLGHKVIPVAYGDELNKPLPKQPEKPKSNEDGYHPETLAGVKRGNPMTFEEADETRANPHVLRGGGYYKNCQSCVVANEARRRGYDVEARPKDTASAKRLSIQTREAWIDPKTGTYPDKLFNHSANTPTRAAKWIDETVQSGQRYTMEYGYKGRTRSGHIVSVDRDNAGNIRILDPQVGKIYTGNAEVKEYLGRAKLNVKSWMGNFSTLEMTRVDNMNFNTNLVNDVLIGAGKG